MKERYSQEQMSKKIIIRINKDGSIHAKTEGIKGKSCMKYMEFFETMLDANIIDSDYTDEYDQMEEEEENNLKEVFRQRLHQSL